MLELPRIQPLVALLVPICFPPLMMRLILSLSVLLGALALPAADLKVGVVDMAKAFTDYQKT